MDSRGTLTIYALLLGDLGSHEKPSEAELFHLPVWARFYDVPFKGRLNGVMRCSLATKSASS